MAKDWADVIELLDKRGMGGGVDFHKEALRVLVDGYMEAEISSPGRGRVWLTDA